MAGHDREVGSAFGEVFEVRLFRDDGVPAMIGKVAVVDGCCGTIVGGGFKTTGHFFGDSIQLFSNFFVGDVQGDGDGSGHAVSGSFSGPARFFSAAIGFFELHSFLPRPHIHGLRFAGWFSEGQSLSLSTRTLAIWMDWARICLVP